MNLSETYPIPRFSLQVRNECAEYIDEVAVFSRPLNHTDGEQRGGIYRCCSSLSPFTEYDQIGVGMQIQSTRFGSLEISHSDLIFMPHGLIGFEDYRHWILLASADSEEVAWLQSVALPDVALPMISPRRFVPNYRLHIQRQELDGLQMHAKDKVFVLSILNRNGKHWTTNLKSPVIMNSTRRLALQVILADDQPLAQPIIFSDEQSLQRVA